MIFQRLLNTVSVLKHDSFYHSFAKQHSFCDTTLHGSVTMTSWYKQRSSVHGLVWISQDT